jgi:hypothetical protein
VAEILSKRITSFSATGIIASIPVLVFFASGARSIEPINGQDGYAYVGVVARTQDFLERFPDSYFGTRFGYVLPSEIFEWIFGFKVGHHMLRFFLLAVVVVLMTIRKRIGFSNSLVVATLFCLSPIVLVSTFSTYPMAVGALALLLGVLVFSIFDHDESPRLLVPAISSSLLAISWNTHLQLLLPSLVLFSVLIGDRVIHEKNQKVLLLVQYGVAGVIGALGTCFTGVLILGTQYGVWNPWAPAFEFASGTSIETFKSEGFAWVTWRQYVLLTPVSIAVGIAVWRSEGDPLIRRTIRRMTLVTISLLITYSYYQWILRNITFETFFHSSGLFIVSTSLLLLSVGALLNRESVSSKVFRVAIVITAVLFYVAGSRIEGNFLLLCILAITICATIFIFLKSRGSIFRLSILGLIGLSSVVTVSSPHDFPATAGGYRTDPLYDDALFSYDRGSMNRAVVVNKISRMLPTKSNFPGEIRVWFEPTSPVDQLSAPLLWYRSALQGLGDPPLPALTPTVIENLEMKPRFIVIIAKDQRQSNSSYVEIRKIANYRIRWSKEVSSDNFVAYVTLLEYQDQ